MASYEEVLRALAKNVNVSGDPDDEKIVADFLESTAPSTESAPEKPAQTRKG